MFSAFSGWVATATDAVKGLSDQGLEVVRQTGVLDALESVSADAGAGAGGAPQNTTLSVEDLMTPPSGWTGSSEEWSWCVEAALRDANTCALTPAALRADTVLWAELKATVAHLIGTPAAPVDDAAAPTLTTAGNSTEASIATTETLMDDTDGTYAPADDLVQYVQAHHAVYQVRSHVVPRFTADEEYWLNLGWRLAIYRQCTSGKQLLTLMRALSRLPQPLRDRANAAKRTAATQAPAQVPAPPADAAATEAAKEVEEAEQPESDPDTEEEEVVLLMDNSEYWRDVYVQLEAMQDRFTWLRETEERVKKEMDLAGNNVRLLGSLLQRKDASGPLAASVCDSCHYHKVKLSRLIGDINAAPAENSAGTVLDPQFGSLFHALVQRNAEVKAVLEAYAGNSQGSPATPKATAAAAAAPTSPLAAAPTQSAPPGQGAAPTEEARGGSAPAAAPAAAPSAPRAPSTGGSSPVELSAAGSAHAAAAPPPGDDDSGEESFEATLPWAVGA